MNRCERARPVVAYYRLTAKLHRGSRRCRPPHVLFRRRLPQNMHLNLASSTPSLHDEFISRASTPPPHKVEAETGSLIGSMRCNAATHWLGRVPACLCCRNPLHRASFVPSACSCVCARSLLGLNRLCAFNRHLRSRSEGKQTIAWASLFFLNFFLRVLWRSRPLTSSLAIPVTAPPG